MESEPLLSYEQPSSPHHHLPPALIHYLYIGHFLARWGARMWEFSVGLYMISLWPNSLLFAAIYGVMESASTAFFGPLVGEWLDRLTYTKVLKLWLSVQNISYIIAGCTVVILTIYTDLKSSYFTVFISLVILTNVSGAVGSLSTLAGAILIEREWVVVISEGCSPDVLTNMNSVIRRIDLTCTLFAPVITGFLISFVSLKASAVTLALWNMISVWLEYWLFVSVYNGIPALAESSQRRISRLALRDRSEGSNSVSSDSEVGSKLPFIGAFIGAWRVYLRQDVLLPGVALALLYFTVLSFGTLMTAALEWEGIPAFIIGTARGISATIGIAATLAYPTLQSRISTIRTGIWSVWSQWICLLLCVGSIWVSNSVSSAYMLMVGVATSRLGLWMFDLAVIQQMQDQVAESDRCVVGGTQNSLQSIMDLMGYVMGIIVSNPQDFWKLILISFLMVTMAALLYTLHVFHIRKHLFHFEKLFMMLKWSVTPSETENSCLA